MEITNTELEWSSEDVDHWAQFLRTQSGQRLIPKIAEAAPRLLAGGETNALLVRNGEVLGFSAAVQTALELSHLPQAPQRGTENYPSLDDDQAWGPESTKH